MPERKAMLESVRNIERQATELLVKAERMEAALAADSAGGADHAPGCRDSMMRAMHRRGMRLDDAALAADVAMTYTRGLRDRLIVAARDAGLSYGQIAAATGVPRSSVHRICSVPREARGGT